VTSNKHKSDNLCDFDTTKKLEPKLSGEILGDTVVSILKEMSIELNDCVGIGTDGCSNMTSTIHGAVQQIKNLQTTLFIVLVPIIH